MFSKFIRVTATLVVMLLSMASVFSSRGYSSNSHESGEEDSDISALFAAAGITPRASHVRVKPFNISIIQDGQIHGLLYVSVDLATGSRDLNIGVVKARPRLRDAYLRTLIRYANNQINPDKPVSIMLIKKLLQRPTDKILGGSEVTVIVSGAHITKSKR